MALFETQLVLKSDLDDLRKVETVIDDLNAAADLGEEKYPNLLIAVTEAFNNAVLHGNKHDLTKKVTITAEAFSEGVVFKVADEGEGFDFDNLPDPTDPENLEKFNGRGVFLMNNLADAVEFNEIGNEVTLKFLK